jgi:hypothetical protein
MADVVFVPKMIFQIITIMQFNNADVVKKFIFRYLDFHLTNVKGNILVNKRRKISPIKSSS